MTDIKPCPFCGCTPKELDLSEETTDDDIYPTAVNCKDCGALGPLVHLKSRGDYREAIDEWNERAL